MYYDGQVGNNVGAMTGRAVKNSMGLGAKVSKAMKNSAQQSKVTGRKLNAKSQTLRLNGPLGIPDAKHRKLFKLRPPGAPI